jgi:hypothetical protein
VFNNSSCLTSTCRKTACNRSFPIWRPAGLERGGDRTTNWFLKVMRRDFIVGFTGAGSGPDPDQNLQLLYGCGGELNYSGYCSSEVDQADRSAIERG